MDNIEEVLLSKLAEKFGGSPQLNDSLALIGVDSVGMAELTFEIEKMFSIHVDDAVLDVETVQELAEYIRARRS
ncbi:MAG: acyl carrier protein [Pirellulales bacterium]